MKILSMDAQSYFEIVSLGRYIIPCLLSIFIMSLTKPKNLVFRLIFAIFSGWVVVIIYTIYLYNQAGIAVGIAKGLENP